MTAGSLGFSPRRAGGLNRGFNWLSHLIIPLLGIAAFVPAWLTAPGTKAFAFVAPLTPPLSYMAPSVAGWMIIGVTYLIFLFNPDPRRGPAGGPRHLPSPAEP